MRAKKLLTSTMAMALGAATLFVGCGSVDPDATLVTINDGEDTISLGYGNFEARYLQSVYDSFYISYYGESYWSNDGSEDGETMEDSTKNNILESIEEEYFLRSVAADYGIELTDEDNEKIAEAVEEFMAANPEETLEAMTASTEIVTQYLENQTYAKLVKEAIEESADVEVTDDECWQRTFSYVFVSNQYAYDEDGNSIEMTDDYLDSLLGEMQLVSNSGEEFDSFAEGLGLTVSTYSYTKGEEEDSTFDYSIIEAAESMSEGDISNVIEVTDTGYYVIRLDSDHDLEASETERDSLISEKQEEYYDSVYEDWKSNTTWEVNDKAWAKVKFDTLFTAIETEEDTEE